MLGFSLPATLEPGYQANLWASLPAEDQCDFLRLQKWCRSGEDRQQLMFRSQIEQIRNFVDRRSTQVQERSIIVGVCFSGGVICSNTRRVKTLLGRSKTSINNGFVSIGYVAANAKVQKILFSLLPQLQFCPGAARQWRVRYADNQAMRRLLPTPIITPVVPRLSLGYCESGDRPEESGLSLKEDENDCDFLSHVNKFGDLWQNTENDVFSMSEEWPHFEEATGGQSSVFDLG
jgi:hypothetical protein